LGQNFVIFCHFFFPDFFQRCFAKFVSLKNLTSKNPIKVETRAGIMELTNHAAGNSVSVNMGKPDFRVQELKTFLSSLTKTHLDGGFSQARLLFTGRLLPGSTKGGSFTVLLTSCLTGLD
jgi:hypothetical protein